MYINSKKFNIKRYSSGEMKLLNEDLLKQINKNIVDIIYENDEIDFFELLILLNFYKSKNIKINLTLTYLPYQRMDKNNNYEIKTIKIIANILNNINLNSLTICEPHCNIEIFNNVKQISLVKLIFNQLQHKLNLNNDNNTLFFIDKGGYKKYSFLSNNCIYANKIRDLKNGLITSYELIGKINPDQNIVIIDDIISTGDTILNALEEIKKINKNQVTIICGHFEKNKHNKRLFNNDQIKMIYSSDSLTKKDNARLTLLKISDLLDIDKNLGV